MLRIYDCKTEYRVDPIGIDAPNPRFSWKIASDQDNLMQSAWRLLAWTDEKLLWDSGPVESSQSQHIRWNGPELTSGQRVRWQVRVWAGREEAESSFATFEMGLLSPEDWHAQWLEPEGQIDPDAFKPCPYLRREFTVRQGLIRARAYQTAHGLYACWFNGLPGTEDKFNPGLTSYHKRLQYQVHDVTNLLREGENTWAVILGDGWWRGTTGGAVRNNFGG